MNSNLIAPRTGSFWDLPEDCGVFRVSKVEVPSQGDSELDFISPVSNKAITLLALQSAVKSQRGLTVRKQMSQEMRSVGEKHTEMDDKTRGRD